MNLPVPNQTTLTISNAIETGQIIDSELVRLYNSISQSVEGKDISYELPAETISFINLFMRRIDKISKNKTHNLYLPTENVNMSFETLTNLINGHNSYEDYLNKNHAVKNSVVHNISKIISSPSNQIHANTPVTVDNLHNAANKASAKYAEYLGRKTGDNDLSSYDMMSYYQQQFNASVGKDDVGIAANGLKGLFALTSYYNNYFKNKIPTKGAGNIKPEVSELFESNPELANEVYEASVGNIKMSYSKEYEEFFDKFKNDKNTHILSLDYILNKETDEITRKLIEALKPYQNKKSKIYYQDNYDFKEGDLFYEYAATGDLNGNLFVFNKDALNSDIILHELMHDFLADEIDYGKNNILLKELNRIFDIARLDSSLVKEYPYSFTDLHEFLSEAFGNKNFRLKLSTIEDNIAPKKSNIFESVLNSIRRLVKSKLNIEISNSLLGSIFNSVENTITHKNNYTNQQKATAQQLYSEYLDTTGKQDIEGFREFVENEGSTKRGIDLNKLRTSNKTFKKSYDFIDDFGNEIHISIGSISDIVISRAQESALKDILGPEYSKTLNNAAVLMSSFTSAATDNAKELIMAKINASTKLASMHAYMMALGFTLDQIVEFMTSETSSLIINESTDNIYYDESPKSITGVIDKLKEDTNINQAQLKVFEAIYKDSKEFTALTGFLGINQKRKADT
jgi:hypothetical protein